jgi:hypothetical protein
MPSRTFIDMPKVPNVQPIHFERPGSKPKTQKFKDKIKQALTITLKGNKADALKSDNLDSDEEESPGLHSGSSKFFSFSKRGSMDKVKEKSVEAERKPLEDRAKVIRLSLSLKLRSKGRQIHRP